MWLAHVADEAKVTSGTMSTYRAALSTEYVERATRGAYEGVVVNPLDDIRVSRFMNGVKNALATSDKEKREARPRTEAMTFGMLSTMARLTPTITNTIEHTRTMAAAHLALAAGLRPSELLGSPVYRDRSLRVDQLIFYMSEDDALPVRNAPPPSDHQCVRVRDPRTIMLVAGLPNHCMLELYVSKTNQRRQSSFTMVGQPAAVEWLWRWFAVRGYDEQDSDELFFHPTLARLTTPSLMKTLTSMATDAGLPDVHFTGKCFRIGAASALAAGGASAEDISVNNRWSAKAGTWTRYTTRSAQQQRALKVNRSME